MVSIPGFPLELREVPPAPFSINDPDADAKRRAWRAWRYDVQVFRTQRQLDLSNNPDLIPFELLRCASHPAYWASMYLRVFEPRWRADPALPIPVDLDADDPDAEIVSTGKIISIPDVPLITSRNLRVSMQTAGAGYDPVMEPIFGYVPFIPFADQVRVINELLWSLTQTDEHADVVWSKSRGWGASWILCLLGLWGWTFSHLWPGAPPWNTLYLSRKEDFVDSKQQKSLFWKIRRLMRDMPGWQMPPEFNPDLHDQKGILVNPFNGNELGGESTNSKAGRGDRVTFAVLDEAAAIPQLMNKYSTLAETTDHRWVSSTESFEEGTDFWDLQHDDENEFKPYLIETDFWQNPLNDNFWLARQERRYPNKDAFMQEVWRKPFTGSTWYYPWAATIKYDPTLKPVSGFVSFFTIDPGFRDPTAIIAVQDSADGYYNVLDAYQKTNEIADFFAPILKPALFDVISPHWRDKSELVWTSTIDSTLSFTYERRDIEFATTIAAIGIPKGIGDTYGDVKVGSGYDSFYDRLRKYGIIINADRKTGDAITPTVKKSRTDAGRKRAMDELSSRWRFADTLGARMAGNAWKNAKYKGDADRAVQFEPNKPQHDSTSHLRTAGEFLAVYLKHRKSVLGRDLSKPVKTNLQGQISHMGANKGNMHRQLRQRLRDEAMRGLTTKAAD